jgi:hypothetical protein
MQLNIAAGAAPAAIAKTGAPELRVLYLGAVNVRDNVDADDYSMLRRMCEVSSSTTLFASCYACTVPLMLCCVSHLHGLHC